MDWEDDPGPCGGVRTSGVRSCSPWEASGSKESEAMAGSQPEASLVFPTSLSDCRAEKRGTSGDQVEAGRPGGKFCHTSGRYDKMMLAGTRDLGVGRERAPRGGVILLVTMAETLAVSSTKSTHRINLSLMWVPLEIIKR